MNLLFGENGTGKTTILQAIEWALTGTVSSFTGVAFKEEDAFINMFSGRKKCQVVLQVVNSVGQKKILVERIRKLSRNSSTTKSNTQLLLGNGKELSGEGAQAELLNILGINSNNFIRNFYIRQDLIHELLEEKPEETSRGLDEILGTTSIRQLIESVDVKSKINSSKRLIDKRIEGLKSDRIAIADNVKQTAENIKRRLIDKGILSGELTLDHSIQLLNRLVKSGEPLANHLNIASFAFKTDDCPLSNLKGFAEGYLEHLIALDTKRQEICSSKIKNSTNISNILASYEGIVTSPSACGDLNISNLESQQKLLESQLLETKTSHENLSSVIQHLTEAKFKIDLIRQKILSHKDEISRMCTEFGPIEAQESLMNKYKNRLDQISEIKESVNLFDSLVHKSVEYIKKSEENKCPVCNRNIDRKELLLILNNKIEGDVAKKLASYEEEERSLLENINKIDRNLSQITEAKSNLQHEEDSYNELSAISKKQMGADLDESIETRIEHLKKDLKLNDDLDIDLKAKMKILQDSICTFEAMASSRGRLEKELQTMLKSDNKGSELIEESKAFKINIEKEIEPLDVNGECQKQIDYLKRETDNLINDHICYLEQEQQVKNLMLDINDNSQLIRKLNEKKKTLELLEGSLSNIREIATLYLEKEVQSQIGSQGKLIDKIYNEIVPHPVFHHIAIDIHDKDPVVYSIMVSDDTNLKTSALTRFSMAQMNIFAISVLFANNIRLCEQFPVLLLDDPTHSMDEKHKEHLSEFICKIGRERQVIVGTSDKDFKNYLQNSCDNQINLIQLGQWSRQGVSVSG